MKKWIVLLCALLSASLVACNVAGDTSSSEAAVEFSAISHEEFPESMDSIDVSEEFLEDAEIDSRGSDEVNAQLEEKLTPPDSTVEESMAGGLILTSTQSTADLIAFYEAALADIGAESLSESKEMGWHYVGFYDGEKEIVISISEFGDSRDIQIVY